MTAPAGPEKNQYGPGKPDDFGLERTVVSVYRVLGVGGGEMKRRTALATDGLFSCP